MDCVLLLQCLRDISPPSPFSPAIMCAFHSYTALSVRLQEYPLQLRLRERHLHYALRNHRRFEKVFVKADIESNNYGHYIF